MSGEPILIVDDNATNLKLARVLLRSEGYEVRTAADAEGALAILADFRAEGDMRAMDQVILGLVLLAIGDSLVGPEIAAATGDDPAAVRDIAIAQVRALVGD